MRKGRKRINVVAVTKKRAVIVLAVFAVLSAYLLGVILRMQLFSYEDYQNRVLEQITTTSSLRARRGTIYASDGSVLATSKTVWRIFLSPIDIKEASDEEGVDYARRISEALSSLLSLDFDSVYQKATRTSRLDETILRGADENTCRAVHTLATQNGWNDMIHTESYYVRQYPDGTLFPHVLGFTGSDSQGLYGLEYSYDAVLKGIDGSYLYAKDANGHEMPNQYVGYTLPTDGSSLKTTLDPYIQEQLMYQLASTAQTYDAQNRVTGVVMDTKTGAILAMGTYPSFDANQPYVLDQDSQEILNESGLSPDSAEYRAKKVDLLYRMWANKAVSETYEPGSTFKVITAAVAVETGATTESDRYSCTGSLTVGGYHISCHKKTGHGTGFTFAYGLQQSCNPTMMTVAAKIGASRFYEYVKAFGYLEKTGIDLPSEANSIFHKPENIGTTELATMSFGQRFKVSIIQQLTAVACVANDGYLVQPYLVEQVIAPDGTVTYQHEPVVKRQVISAKTAREISSILEEGVSGDGGAKNAYVPGYTVAAKTGTSEKFDILDENGNSYLRIGSCVGYAPAEDPRIAVIIVVDEPQNGKYGSMVAAPYLSGVLANVLPYLGIEPTFNESDLSAEVPSLVGLSLTEAEETLKGVGLSCQVIGDGQTITSQMPSAGVRLSCALGKVILYTDGAEEEFVRVPSVVGMTAEEANRTLLSLGLNIGISGAANYYIGQNAYVESQSCEANFSVKRGTVITLRFIHTDGTD